MIKPIKTKKPIKSKVTNAKTAKTNAPAKETNKGGRPRIEINYEQLNELCKVQCTGEECAAELGMDYDTLNKRLKEDGFSGFSEYFARFRQPGLTSLRKKQYQVADSGDTKMLIHLGKNWLGQSDKTSVDHTSKDGSMSPVKGIKRTIVDNKND